MLYELPILQNTLNQSQYHEFKKQIHFENQEQVVVQNTEQEDNKNFHQNANIKNLVAINRTVQSVLQVPQVRKNRYLASALELQFPQYEFKNYKLKQKPRLQVLTERDAQLYKQDDRNILYQQSKRFTEGEKWTNLTELPEITIKHAKQKK